MIITESVYKTDQAYKVIQIIEDKLGIDKNILSDKTSFPDDLSVDSLDMYEFIMEIEKEFKITIPDEEAEKLTSVGAVIDYINKNTQ